MPKEATGVRHLAVDKLRVARTNPRRNAHDDKIVELEASIRAVGVIEPLIVRSDPNRKGGFIILAGQRRYTAGVKAGLQRFPVVVRDDLTELDAELLMLSENLHRRDLSHLETATVYARLMKLFSLNQAEIGERVGKSQAHVQRHLVYLKLPKSTIERCERGEIAFDEALGIGIYRDPAKPKAPQGRKSLHELQGHSHCSAKACEVRKVADQLSA